MKAAATAPRPMKNQRCQPEALARNEKAAPVLWAWTMSSTRLTVCVSPSAKLWLTTALVSWSIRITASAIASQGRIDADFLVAMVTPPCALRRRRTGCWCSARRSSDATDRCDIAAVVPAALALRRVADRGVHEELAGVGGVAGRL